MPSRTSSNGFPTPETIQRAHDDVDLQNALEAYHFFYPTVSMEGSIGGTRDAGIEDNKSALVMACQPRHLLFTGKTIPGQGWFAYLRIYGPTQPAFDGSWKPGDFEKTK